MTRQPFTLRAARPEDSAAIAGLVTEGDGALTTHFVCDPFTAITAGTEDRTVAVVAECPGEARLAGMATVRFGRVQFNDRVLPLAGLDGLKVREEYRRQGLGRQLAEWRIAQAQREYGDECLIITGMVRDNHASRAVARRWCREFIEPVHVVVRSTRAAPPRPPATLRVREVEPADYEAFAARRDRSYQSYHLQKPIDPESIANCLGLWINGQPIYRLYMAVDRAGNLLAGARLRLRGLFMKDVLAAPPLPLRLLNRVAHVFPEDYQIREINVDNVWYAEGHAQAARHLWESLRWHGHAFGSTLTLSLDPRDPLLALLQVRPWHGPRVEIALALHGPIASDRKRLVTGVVRV